MTVLVRRAWPAMAVTSLALVAVIVVLLMNTGSSRRAPFTLNSLPHQQAVHGGESVRFTLTATFASGYRGEVQLRSGQLPDGISVRFSHDSLAPGSSASTDVTVSITTAVSAGTYELPVIGGSGDTIATEGLMLVVLSGRGEAPPGLRQLVGSETSSR